MQLHFFIIPPLTKTKGFTPFTLCVHSAIFIANVKNCADSLRKRNQNQPRKGSLLKVVKVYLWIFFLDFGPAQAFFYGKN